MAQSGGVWRSLRGAVEDFINNKETKEQSAEILSSLLGSFVVQLICFRV
jgi:hypothetical protein